MRQPRGARVGAKRSREGGHGRAPVAVCNGSDSGGAPQREPQRGAFSASFERTSCSLGFCLAISRPVDVITHLEGPNQQRRTLSGALKDAPLFLEDPSPSFGVCNTISTKATHARELLSMGTILPRWRCAAAQHTVC